MPFVKGRSGNPSGRPKKENTLTGILEQLAEKKDVDYAGEKIARRQAIAETLWQMAIQNKDFQAIKYIYDRIDGLPQITADLEHFGNVQIIDNIPRRKK